MSEVERWVSLEDIARHLDVSKDTIRSWIKKETIPYHKVGRQYKFRVSEVDAWVERRESADADKQAETEEGRRAGDSRKEREREELHRAIWAIADDLRGAVDGWDFKNYVLGTMFYRYISENLTAYINSGEIEAGNKDFDYAKMSDKDAEEAREGLVEEKGFFILPSELFCNVRAKADRNEIWKYPNGADMRLNEIL